MGQVGLRLWRAKIAPRSLVHRYSRFPITALQPVITMRLGTNFSPQLRSPF
jgi:hypothetical protein